MSKKIHKMRVVLNGRPSVRIDPKEWPMIARARGDTWKGSDHERYQQAIDQGEISTYWINVRRHADGRVLVYGWVFKCTGTCPEGMSKWRGGHLLDSGADDAAIVEAVRDLVSEAKMPRSMVASVQKDMRIQKILEGD